MAAAAGKSAKTLETLFSHPIPTNLHWADVLTLLQRFGTVEHHRHGKLHIDIAGRRLTLKYSGEKQLDKDQVTQLRHFLESLGIVPGHPELDVQDPKPFEEPPLVIVIDHHEADLWLQEAPGKKLTPQTAIEPHDPRHFRHHLRHRRELREKGQRPSEDVHFYKTLVQALENAPRALVIGNASGHSSAMQQFRTYLAEHHKALLQRVTAFVDADLSALTEPKIREIAARYWS